MNQSNFIFGALALAFVVFITMRGSLPVYMRVLFGGAQTPADSKPAETEGGASDTLNDWIKKGVNQLPPYNFFGGPFWMQ